MWLTQKEQLGLRRSDKSGVTLTRRDQPQGKTHSTITLNEETFLFIWGLFSFSLLHPHDVTEHLVALGPDYPKQM